MTLEIWDSLDSSEENTIPENNTGHVSSNVVPNLPKGVEGKPPARAIHHPAARAAHTRK
jgi:hypothetical protein